MPSDGEPAGASEEPVSSPRSASALTTYALLATPKNEYSLFSQYSFSSLPCNGLLDESV